MAHLPRSNKLPPPLSLKFYQRDTEKVARELLGCILYRQFQNEILAARIVETEAYLGLSDKAAHSHHGKRTARVEPMWRAGGCAYIYLIYGMHECFNVVTQKEGRPEAVLVRAAEPLLGEDRWREELPHLKKSDWMKGPGRLCRAMHIHRPQSGDLLNGAHLWIAKGSPPQKIRSTPRIGIAYSEECAEWPLRFFDADSECVSGPRKLNN